MQAHSLESTFDVGVLTEPNGFKPVPWLNRIGVGECVGLDVISGTRVCDSDLAETALPALSTLGGDRRSRLKRGSYGNDCPLSGSGLVCDSGNAETASLARSTLKGDRFCLSGFSGLAAVLTRSRFRGGLRGSLKAHSGVVPARLTLEKVKGPGREVPLTRSNLRSRFGEYRRVKEVPARSKLEDVAGFSKLMERNLTQETTCSGQRPVNVPSIPRGSFIKLSLIHI